MQRKDKIGKAYRAVGDTAEAYDGMMTCSSWLGKLICRLIWNLDEEKSRRYVDTAFSGIPKGFRGRLLEIPVGTGCLSLPVYQGFPEAEIVCMDYVEKMLEAARKRAASLDLRNVEFRQGDVGKLPFDDGSFDVVLTVNGLHAFPDKEAAFRELNRVLKPGGIFCGTCYVAGEQARTDFFVRHVFVRGGFFTPPFDTVASLRARLEEFCRDVSIVSVEAETAFVCRKR